MPKKAKMIPQRVQTYLSEAAAASNYPKEFKEFIIRMESDGYVFIELGLVAGFFADSEAFTFQFQCVVTGEAVGWSCLVSHIKAASEPLKVLAMTPVRALLNRPIEEYYALVVRVIQSARTTGVTPEPTAVRTEDEHDAAASTEASASTDAEEYNRYAHAQYKTGPDYRARLRRHSKHPKVVALRQAVRAYFATDDFYCDPLVGGFRIRFSGRKVRKNALQALDEFLRGNTVLGTDAFTWEVKEWRTRPAGVRQAMFIRLK